MDKAGWSTLIRCDREDAARLAELKDRSVTSNEESIAYKTKLEA